MQGWPKRNTRGSEPLFDRNGQPSDQPRYFIELTGVMVFNGARKPREAFVVAHLGHGGRYDRGYREVGLNRGHQGTSRIEPAEPSLAPIETFWRPLDDTGCCGGPE